MLADNGICSAEREDGLGVKSTFEFDLMVVILVEGIPFWKASSAGPHEKPMKLVAAPGDVDM